MKYIQDDSRHLIIHNYYAPTPLQLLDISRGQWKEVYKIFRLPYPRSFPTDLESVFSRVLYGRDSELNHNALSYYPGYVTTDSLGIAILLEPQTQEWFDSYYDTYLLEGCTVSLYKCLVPKECIGRWGPTKLIPITELNRWMYPMDMRP